MREYQENRRFTSVVTYVDFPFFKCTLTAGNTPVSNVKKLFPSSLKLGAFSTRKIYVSQVGPDKVFGGILTGSVIIRTFEIFYEKYTACKSQNNGFALRDCAKIKACNKKKKSYICVNLFNIYWFFKAAHAICVPGQYVYQTDIKSHRQLESHVYDIAVDWSSLVD